MIELMDLRQQTDYDCGVVCCQIVREFFGLPRRRVPASQIDGTDPRTIEAALRQAGLPVLSGEMALSDLAHFARTRRPVIVLAKSTSTPETGHYMVCRGQRDRRLHFQCPTRGPVVEMPSRFERRWHDVDRLGTRYSRWGIVVG